MYTCNANVQEEGTWGPEAQGQILLPGYVINANQPDPQETLLKRLNSHFPIETLKDDYWEKYSFSDQAASDFVNAGLFKIWKLLLWQKKDKRKEKEATHPKVLATNKHFYLGLRVGWGMRSIGLQTLCPALKGPREKKISKPLEP